jgi:hypothetical protein
MKACQVVPQEQDIKSPVTDWNPLLVSYYLQHIVSPQLCSLNSNNKVDPETLADIQKSFQYHRFNGLTLLGLRIQELRDDLKVSELGYQHVIFNCIKELQQDPLKNINTLIEQVELQKSNGPKKLPWRELIYRKLSHIYRLFLSPRITFEDVAGLLQTLIFQAALMLSFSMNALSNLDHDSLFEADERCLTFQIQPLYKTIRGHHWSETSRIAFEASNASRIMNDRDPLQYSLLSLLYFDSVFYSLSSFTAVFFLGSVLYIRLVCSKARVNNQILEAWISRFFPFIFVGCGL